MRIRWFGLLLLIAAMSWAQQAPPPFPNPHIPHGSEPSGPPPMSPRQVTKYNKQRYTQLQRDSDELLQLATQLKQEVDKANSNTLSVDVIKKTEQIEKLAKSVREKMKGF